MFYPGFQYKPPCHWCNTPHPDHTKTCRFRPKDEPKIVFVSCKDCGTKDDNLHPTWCPQWVDYAKRKDR